MYRCEQVPAINKIHSVSHTHTHSQLSTRPCLTHTHSRHPQSLAPSLSADRLVTNLPLHAYLSSMGDSSHVHIQEPHEMYNYIVNTYRYVGILIKSVICRLFIYVSNAMMWQSYLQITCILLYCVRYWCCTSERVWQRPLCYNSCLGRAPATRQSHTHIHACL